MQKKLTVYFTPLAGNHYIFPGRICIQQAVIIIPMPQTFILYLRIKSIPTKSISMKFSTACVWILVITAISSCASVKDIPKYQLADGCYKSKLFTPNRPLVYVDNNEDTIAVYRVEESNKSIDSFIGNKKVFPEQTIKAMDISTTFSQGSFDIDFLTIPFK